MAMAVTQLDLARQEHEQASRQVRHLEQEARARYPMWNIRDRTAAKERQQKAAAELTRLLDEQMYHVHTRDCYDDPGPGHGSPQLICGIIATRPDGAESRRIESNPSQPQA